MTGYTIYADGACPSNGTRQARAGWGAYLINPQGDTLELAGPVPGSDPQTNNRGELLACLEALARCKQGGPITVISDSQLLVKGATEWLTSWKTKNWKNAKRQPVEHVDLWKRIDAAMQAREVSFRWVRGHSGDPGNERADALACQGAVGKKVYRLTRKGASA